MKTITDMINESKKIEFTPTFDVKDDIYSVLSSLATEYDKANKGAFDDKREIAAALDSFMSKFFDE